MCGPFRLASTSPRSSMHGNQLALPIHWNHALLHDLAPLTILLCWTYFQDRLCRSFRLALSPLEKKNPEHLASFIAHHPKVQISYEDRKLTASAYEECQIDFQYHDLAPLATSTNKLISLIFLFICLFL